LKSTARNAARPFVITKWSLPSSRISSSVTPRGLPFPSTAVAGQIGAFLTSMSAFV
jgi:hypothetical protein